eukprot:m.240679 g.240679  ORF g.240679 m.240679 type:complete len:490 (+) comp15826_c0_seq8:2929-4398(+)
MDTGLISSWKKWVNRATFRQQHSILRVLNISTCASGSYVLECHYCLTLTLPLLIMSRFGFTLVRDGFFTHELGDSWHGQDWRYDEEDFVLGLPKDIAHVVPVPSPPSPPPSPAVDLRSEAGHVWFGPGDSGVATIDTVDVPPGALSANKITITLLNNPSNDHVDLQHDGITLTAAQRYTLTFWAKSSVVIPGPIELNTRLDHDPWSGLGLNMPQRLSTKWAQYNATFTSPLTSNESRVSFYLGVQQNVTIWIGSVILAGVPPLPPRVLRRDYDCGVVIWNADKVKHTISLGPGFQRIPGTQAPLHQYIVDDDSNAFAPISGNWTKQTFEHGYSMSSPQMESDFPPYWHHFEVGAHTARQGAQAQFDLQIPQSDLYNISLWWPAASSLQPQWSPTMNVHFSCPGASRNTTSVNLQVRGDEWELVATDVQLSSGCVLLLECVDTGLCIADAVLIESKSRYNDNAQVVQSVDVTSMDSIVLSRIGAGGSCLN